MLQNLIQHEHNRRHDLSRTLRRHQRLTAHSVSCVKFLKEN